MDKKKKISLVVFGVGVLSLIAGVVVMLVNFLSAPETRDADFLVEAGSFTREDAPSVVWNFRETGKGNLTTDGGTNNYEFIWAVEGDKLKIETDWLYDLNDEFKFKIDREAKTLTLSDEDEATDDIIFRAITSDSE
ncbi:MAG: DUF5640 domain-containing protein [Candidatus Saccharibacteria bacterium]|nr:DUF5640 domain-containing protein [Candidatus Saccharibacteria bacterium]